MGAISEEALAAHNIVYQITFIVFQVAIGLSQGASILVSRAVVHRHPQVMLSIMRPALTAVAIVAVAQHCAIWPSPTSSWSHSPVTRATTRFRCACLCC